MNREYDGVQIDIFAAAVTLYNMVTGVKPFSEATPNDADYAMFY